MMSKQSHQNNTFQDNAFHHSTQQYNNNGGPGNGSSQYNNASMKNSVSGGVNY